MRFFLCTGPIIAMTARKPRCILALTSTNPSHQKYFSLMAKRMNVLLSARYSCLVRQESWIVTTSVIKILISGRQKGSPLYAVSGKYKKTCIKSHAVKPNSIVFYDAMVLLGTPGVNQTEKELRVVGYRVDNKVYWVATNRYDLSAEEIATVYNLRWNIEIFFGWWKRHLKVYHLIARSEHGLMTQIWRSHNLSPSCNLLS